MSRSPLTSAPLSRAGAGIAIAALLLAPAVALAASPRELGAQVDALSVQVKAAQSALRQIQKGYTARPEPTDDDVLRARFAEAEIHFVSGEYQAAALLLYDLVSTEAFKKHRRYPDALSLLAESLYQQRNYIGARLYLRELLGLSREQRRRALARYIDVSGRLNDFSGIDLYVDEAREQRGELPSEVAYVYGKWLFRRSDLPKKERLARAQELFGPLAKDPRHEHRLQSQFFLGAVQLQLGDLEKAAAHFEAVAAAEPGGARELKLVELARLAAGRVRLEQGKYPQALAAYAAIPQSSEAFPEALYESAWASVRAEQFEEAKRSLDTLLALPVDSPLIPQAQLLQAHLALKLRRYDEAEATYKRVIDRYLPVHDEVGAVLSVRKDPAAYFDDLLGRNEKKLDLAALLPPVALKWAQVHAEVGDAVKLVSDLDDGRRTAAEAREIAQRLLDALQKRRLESFPAVQEGFARAEALDTRLSRLSAGLLRLELALTEATLEPRERAALRKVQDETGAIARRLQALPSSPEEVEARRQRLREKVDAVDKDAFRVFTELSRLDAILDASEKWLAQQRAGRRLTEDRELLLAMRHEKSALLALRAELEETRRALSIERASVDATLGGETELRLQFDRAVAAQHAAIDAAERRATGEAAVALLRAHAVRGELTELKERLATTRKIFRYQLEDRGARFKDRVALEEDRLDGYRRELGGVTTEARQLVGKIAFTGFEKVRQQFFELALKADVGLLDVAFTRKQDFTSDIQRLAAQKEAQLRALDAEFEEVLQDSD